MSGSIVQFPGYGTEQEHPAPDYLAQVDAFRTAYNGLVDQLVEDPRGISPETTGEFTDGVHRLVEESLGYVPINVALWEQAIHTLHIASGAEALHPAQQASLGERGTTLAQKLHRMTHHQSSVAAYYLGADYSTAL
ncbi:MAG: hypothetical protein ABH879_04395 [archaeon]